MWNSKKSIYLSLALTVVFAIGALVLCALMPHISKLYITALGDPPHFQIVLLTIYYLFAAFSLYALYLLVRLLTHLLKGRVFTDENVRILRRLSWCSFIVGLIMFAGCYWFPLMIIFAMAFAFIGLMLRVVKHVMAEATRIRRENELTI